MKFAVLNRNHIKILACLTMLIDHAGVLLFPESEWLYYIGRLSMPLFAYCIAEGCRYTSNKWKYFLRVLILGLLCQAFYLGEQLLSGRIHSYYFNILLTFSFSMVICFAYLFWEKQSEKGESGKTMLAAFLFFGSVLLAFLADEFCVLISDWTHAECLFDYGFRGMILPLAAVIGKDHKTRFVTFSLGIILFCITSYQIVWYVWFALLDILILAFYNGKKGKWKMQYVFYLFYPLHLGVLYLLYNILI